MMIKKRLLPIGAALLFIIIINTVCHLCLSFNLRNNAKFMKNGWDISVNNITYTNKDITRLYDIPTDNLRRGDTLVFRTVLPDLGELSFPTLLFKSKYTTLECYVDNTLIYEYALDMYEKHAFIGKSYHYMILPRDYQNRTLTIKAIVAEDNPATNYEAPVLGNNADVENGFIHDNITVISTGIFMFVFGVIYLFVCLLFATAIPNIMSQIFESILCMNLGVWLLSYFNLFTLFYYTRLETQIEYFTLYLITPISYFILLCIQKIDKKRVFNGIVIVSCLIPCFQYILHCAFNIHLRVTLPIYHADSLFGFAVILVFLYQNYKRRDINASEMIQMAGLTTFSVALFIHYLIYILNTSHLEKYFYFNRIVICIGCISLAISMLANYLVYVTRTYAQRQEHASLSHLAYADGLTNLANRAKADRIVDDLVFEKDDYCIISIDLNGLKLVNDKFGHPTGDRYIKDFAKVLDTTFGENDFCARIGGDEFLAVVKNAGSKDIPGMIDRMNSALNVMNAIYSEYHRSISTGFAYWHELEENNPHEVYLLADQRMYENKRIMHEKLGIHNRL